MVTNAVCASGDSREWQHQEYSLQRHYNLVFLHARGQTFPGFADIARALQDVWPWGEVACVQEVAERLGDRWQAPLV
ncbi:MAG: hypothetical protein AUF64_00560 [Chloroflexi bacterium 13_1_20CM_54_36]|nr:MAG: hypothetical protein AUF64_00560 [Chloroflexi bacterium 13_1_20CM_54_36]